MKIRTQIALLIGGVAVPLIVLATIVTAVLIQRERVAVESGLRDTVRALSLALDRELANTTTTLRAVAASLASERGDVRLFRDEAARVFQSQQPDWLTLLIVDSSGRIIIDARGPMSSEDGVDQWIDLRPGETRAPVIGGVRRDPRTQEYGYPVAVPVAADSPTGYVLVAVVRPLTIERMLTAQRFENIPLMAVFDGSARVVARHGVAEQGTGQPVGPLMQSMLERHATEELVRGTNREGVAVYTAFRRSGRGNWGVAVGVPAVAIEAGPRRVLWTVGIVGLALIAVSVAIAAVAGLRIQGAVTDLARGATQLGQGQRPEATRSHLSEVRSVNSALIAAADTIQERSEAAQAAQTQAERANRAKDEFLAMLGHELRNPLGAIAGAVTLLDVAKADPPTTEQAHAVIRRQSQHLARLVDDLLEVSRVTSGRVALVLQPVDLGEVVTRAVGMWRSAGRFDEHQLSLETESVWVAGDETRLEQILSNLVGNALKYTPARGNVSIRVSVRGDVAILEVADTGVGIPPSLLERIFDLFVQGDRTLDRAQGGLGIGLTVVKALVEMHGGRVGARSDGAGKGAAFTIWMPRLPEGSHHRRVVDSRSAARPKARRIVIIEDNADMREVLRVQLSLEGHEVQVAVDGEAGVALATTSAPDVVLVDIGLPGLDGYGVAREIAGATRVRTLLPLLRTFVQIVVAVMAVMIGLAGLGVNIGPLLAGAGIAGIAIGFGTQTLVRDIVSGVFFLVDDSFRLGEYVDVGPVKGTVERISLRSMQIRHHRGALHTIPFGEVKRLTNHSREWVIHKVELPLPPETDLDVIRKMLKRIGEELVADPELGPHILRPLKSQGLMQVEDGALILRAKFMVRPDDQQFVVRREVLSRIKRALEDKGIRFAPRQVLVHVAQPARAPDAPAPTPANGNPVTTDAAAGAAAVALSRPPASDPAAVPAKRES